LSKTHFLPFDPKEIWFLNGPDTRHASIHDLGRIGMSSSSILQQKAISRYHFFQNLYLTTMSLKALNPL